MTRTHRGSLIPLVGSLLLTCAAGAVSFAVVHGGLRGAALALGPLIAVGTVGVIGVRQGERTRRHAAPVLVGVDDQLAAVLVGVWMLTVTFNGIQVVSGVSLGDVPLLGAAVVALLGALRRSRPRPVPLPGWLYLATYLLVVSGVAGPLVVGGGVSHDLVPAFRFAVTLFGVVAVLTLVAWSPPRRRLFIDLWLVSVGINCIVAISDRVGTTIGSTITGFSYSYAGHREAGLTQHPTHLGLVCAMALPVALTFALDRTSRLPARLASMALVILIGAAIILTGSRTALLAATVSGLVVPIFVEHTRVGLAAVLGTAAAVAIMAALLSSASFSSISPLPNRTSTDLALSNSGHLADVRNAQTLFLDHPLVGSGFSKARSAQDIYLQLLEAGGVVAISAFAVFLSGVLRAGLALVRRLAADDRERALAGALMVATISWLVEGLFQPPIYDRYLYVPAGLIIATALSKRSASARTREAARQLRLQLRGAGASSTTRGRG